MVEKILFPGTSDVNMDNFNGLLIYLFLLKSFNGDKFYARKKKTSNMNTIYFYQE